MSERTLSFNNDTLLVKFALAVNQYDYLQEKLQADQTQDHEYDFWKTYLLQFEQLL